MASPVEDPPSTVETPLAVETSELAFSFGRRQVLHSLSLKVPEGGIYGLLGRNAAGKTTTLKLLMGILRPRQGRITLLGRPVRRVSPKMRAQIGYVSQEPRFYSWMRLAELARFVGAFYPSWDNRRLHELFERFRLDPQDRVRALSTGSRMKLAVALALAHRPRLLLLDEPTAGVDPVTRREILDILKAETRGTRRTALLSTHDLVEIEGSADRVGILHGGIVRRQGSVGDLRARFRRLPLGLPHEGAPCLFEDERGAVVEVEPGVEDLETLPASLEDIFFGLTHDDGRRSLM